MERQIFFFTTLMLISCGQSASTDDNKIVGTVNDTSTQLLPTPNFNVNNDDTKFEKALAFINGYVDNCSKMNQSIDVVDWVNSNDLVTQDFRTELKKILDNAYRQEPEIGLGFDPLLDAQDFPDKGFELESLDEKTNYLTVRGKDWQDFKLTMKIIEENGNWLVDGCGIINIPTDKRAER